MDGRTFLPYFLPDALMPWRRVRRRVSSLPVGGHFWISPHSLIHSHVHTFDTDTGEKMVACSHIFCPRGRWFHLSCIGTSEDTLPQESEDWWCNDACKEKQNVRSTSTSSSGIGINLLCEVVAEGMG